MSLRIALSLLALLALSACTQLPSKSVMPETGTAATPVVDAHAMSAQRDIVLAVSNPISPPSRHAGSDLLGYTPPKYYGAGQHAASMLELIKRQYHLKQVAGWPIKPLGLYCVVVHAPPGVSRDRLLASLTRDQRVQLAQPLQHFSVYADPAKTPAAAPAIQTEQPPHQYNDPYVDLQRGFVATHAAAAQRITQGGGVDVAVVDTGVDLAHRDLAGRIAHAQDEVGADPGSFNHDYHGTEVAGIIAADGNNGQGIVGMAPKVRLNVYKACWYPQTPPHAGARCNSFTLAKALAAIVGTKTRIINLSLGGPPDPLLDKLLLHLLHEGRIVIAALPPDGDMKGFPDGTPGVIVVRKSAPSPAPPGVLSAPGDDILTTQPDGGYDFTSGSSMSAAHVSGIAALLLSMAPELDVRTLHRLLLQSSRITDGVLQVNAAAAVATLRRNQHNRAAGS